MNLSPSAPVFGEQFRRELLPVVIAHDKAGVQFLDSLGRREAAGCHQKHNVTSSVTRKVTTATTLGENDSSKPWGWIKVKRPRPDVEALEAKRVMTNSLSLTPTIPFPALSSIILWDNAIMRQASTNQGGYEERFFRAASISSFHLSRHQSRKPAP